jgi:hypothetical protein
VDGTGAEVMSLAVASGNCLTVGYVMAAQPLNQEADSVAPLIVAVMFGHDQMVRILLDIFKPNDPLPCTGTDFFILI